MQEYRLQLPQTRAELVAAKNKLALLDPEAASLSYIDTLLRDGDAGELDFAPEPIATQEG